jgi:type II secretory pathway component PulJ
MKFGLTGTQDCLRLYPPSCRQSSAGFTVLEALVALTLAALVISAVSSLVATAIRGTWSSEAHFRGLQLARRIMSELPGRNKLAPGITQGTTENTPWKLDVHTFDSDNQLGHWRPQEIVLTVNPRGGRSIVVRTVRILAVTNNEN